MHHTTIETNTTMHHTTIKEAKIWMRDFILRDDEDKDQIDDLDDLAIIRGIDRYYDGGWLQFVRNLADPENPKTRLQFLKEILNV